MYRIDDLDRWSARSRATLFVVLSLAFTLAFYAVWPHEYMFDDGAIVLRYMDHFAVGAFYKYNLSDPPVFGVSGFVHALVSGALAASRVVSPEGALRLANALGVGLTALAVLLVLRRVTASLVALVAGWAFVLVSSFYFISTAFQGLEAPLHLAIVLFATWAFLSGRRNASWALCALAVISKLDAVPFVAVLVALRAVSLRGREAWTTELRAALLWGAAPLVVWAGFTTLVFGSPLPQSAYAKLSFHFHPPSRIGFLTEWWFREDRHVIAYGLVTISALLVLALLRRGSEALRLAVLPLGSAAVLGLFMVYNPGERMPWYYVLPQVLLVLGAVASGLAALRVLPRWVVAVLALGVLGGAMPWSVAKALHNARGQLAFIHMAEPERIAVGRYLDEAAGPDDTVMTGYGHVARYARRYVYDASGLNSPQVTDAFERRQHPVAVLEPDWWVRNRFLTPADQEQLGYTLDRVFYERSARGAPAWRVWRRGEGSVAVPVAKTEIESDGGITPLADAVEPALLHVRTRSGVTFARATAEPAARGLVVGVRRTDRARDLVVRVDGFASPLVVAVPAVDAADPAEGNVFGFTVTVPDTAAVPTRIHIAPDDPEDELLVLEPVWRIARDRGREGTG